MSYETVILRELKAGKKLSQLTVLRDFGCMRLAHVIYKLRLKDHPIRTTWRTQRGKRFAVYRYQLPEDE